jgi:hypothetical protein
VSPHTLHTVIKRKNMDPFAVFDVVAGVDCNHIAELDTKVVASN